MPTDVASKTVTVDAPLETVLATLRDVAAQPAWVKEVRTAEVLDKNEDGTPAQARLTASTPVGSDEYVLAYEHRRDGMSWSLVRGRLQTAQDGSYSLRRKGKARTDVTFELKISHHLPLPGFVRRRVIEGLVDSTLTGLQAHVSSS